jgi:hypothetical protein
MPGQIFPAFPTTEDEHLKVFRLGRFQRLSFESEHHVDEHLYSPQQVIQRKAVNPITKSGTIFLSNIHQMPAFADALDCNSQSKCRLLRIGTLALFLPFWLLHLHCVQAGFENAMTRADCGQNVAARSADLFGPQKQSKAVRK